jgi:general secretion pathway protein K
MALLITLLVMVILAVLVHEFTFSTRVHLAAAANARDQLQAECLAFSGVEAALSLLEPEQPEQEEGADTDEEAEEEVATEEEEEDASFDETLADTLEEFQSLSQQIQEFSADALAEGEGSFTVQVVDESAKIDINGLMRDDNTVDSFLENQLRRLLRLFGHPDEELDSLMDPLLDWLDEDDDRRPEGAEEVDYQALNEPYVCRNGPLRTLGELALVEGWEGFWEIRIEDGPAFADLLTVGPTGGRVNINTAVPVTLQSLSERIDESIADDIVARREELPYDDTADLLVVLGFLPREEQALILDHVQTRSSLVSLFSKGTFRRAIAGVEVLVRKEAASVEIISQRIE